jgi:hypothetical protein
VLPTESHTIFSWHTASFGLLSRRLLSELSSSVSADRIARACGFASSNACSRRSRTNGTLLPLDCFRDCCSWSCLRPIQQSRSFVLGAFVSFLRRRWRPAGGLIDVEGIQPQFPGGSPGAAICHNSAKCSSGRPSLECKIVWHHS